jgi:hypothetical protein
MKEKDKSRYKSANCKHYLHLCGFIITFYYESGFDLSAFGTDFTKEQFRKCTHYVTILALCVVLLCVITLKIVKLTL